MRIMRKEYWHKMDLLYYYTTSETMKYILTQGDIFATHISYLNDSEEYNNGLRKYISHIKRRTLFYQDRNAL